MILEAVVAHTGKNLNNRIFTYDVISDCYKQALKRKILVYEYNSNGNNFENLLGTFQNPAISYYYTTCETKKYPQEDEITYVLLGQIVILENKTSKVIERLTTKPIVFIIQGFGNLSSSLESGDGSMVVSNYTLESIQLVNKEDSAFEHCLLHGDWKTTKTAMPIKISPVKENKNETS